MIKINLQILPLMSHYLKCKEEIPLSDTEIIIHKIDIYLFHKVNLYPEKDIDAGVQLS